MKKPFQNRIIDNPNHLFGRDNIINRLLIRAQSGDNANIIGCRRFGKSSLINCICKKIADSNTNVYPIVFDFRNIKGDKAIFSTMTALFWAQLCKDKIFTEKNSFGAIEITPSEDEIDILEQLKDISLPRIQKLLEKSIILFNSLIECHFLFIIDEYEYLFKYGFENSNSFMTLRALADMTNEKNEPIFSYWLVGAVSWDKLSHSIGSGVANNITVTEYVCPISKDHFKEMWMAECEIIEDNNTKNILIGYLDEAYRQSGGVPFYGKLLGSHIYELTIAQNKEIEFNYSLCKGQLQELLELENYEHILNKIVAKPTQKFAGIIYQDLKNRGIVIEEGKQTTIVMQLLNDYIIDINKENAKPLNVPKPISLTDDVKLLIENINKTRENKRKELIFPPVIDQSSTYMDLSIPCYTEEQFEDFISSLWRIYYEWTKDSNGYNRKRLPKNHKVDFQNNDFSKYITLRHTIGKAHQSDYYNPTIDQPEKATILESLTGSKNEPFKPEEFYNLQMILLNKFKEVLVELQKFVNAEK